MKFKKLLLDSHLIWKSNRWIIWSILPCAVQAIEHHSKEIVGVSRLFTLSRYSMMKVLSYAFIPIIFTNKDGIRLHF